MTASPMDSKDPNAYIAPGIYPGPGSATGLRYWNGSAWDPRPVARTWPRVWCNIIDNVIAGVVAFALLAFILIPFAFASLPDNDGLNSLAAWLPLLVVFIGYFTVSYRLWGRTPGMMLGRLYVMHIPSGQSRLGWGTAMGRATGLILGYACGIFTIIWLVTTASSRTNQGPHDSWARTGVLVEVGPPLGATHLVSGSAASVAATRGPSAAAPPPTPRPDPPPSTPPRNPPASVAGAPQQAVQEGAEPTEKSGNETVSPEITLGDRARHSEHLDTASLAVADDSQDLAIEPQRQRTRLPLVLGSAAAGVLLLAGAIFALLYIDSRHKATEMNNLISAAAESQSAIWFYANDDRWSETEEALAKAQATSGQQEDFYDRAWSAFVYDTASAARPHVIQLQAAILDVEAVAVLPWHNDIQVAKQAYLDHANVWMKAIMQRTMHDESAQRLYGPTENYDAEIDSTKVIAERRFQDVSILFAPRVIPVRITGLFL